MSILDAFTGGDSEPSGIPVEQRTALRAATEAQSDPSLAWHLTATWHDVRAKAKRIMREGGVHIFVVHNGIIGAQVKGDHGVYETHLTRLPGHYAVANFDCGCKWASFAFDREGPFKRFQGRMCSHALALHYDTQSRQVAPARTTPEWLRPGTEIFMGHDAATGTDMTRVLAFRTSAARWPENAPVDAIENLDGYGSDLAEAIRRSAADLSDLECDHCGSLMHTPEHCSVGKPRCRWCSSPWHDSDSHAVLLGEPDYGQGGDRGFHYQPDGADAAPHPAWPSGDRQQTNTETERNRQRMSDAYHQFNSEGASAGHDFRGHEQMPMLRRCTRCGDHALVGWACTTYQHGDSGAHAIMPGPHPARPCPGAPDGPRHTASAEMSLGETIVPNHAPGAHPTKPRSANDNPASSGWATAPDPDQWSAAPLYPLDSRLGAAREDPALFEATLHDWPEGALPTTDGAGDGELNADDADAEALTPMGFTAVFARTAMPSRKHPRPADMSTRVFDDRDRELGSEPPGAAGWRIMHGYNHAAEPVASLEYELHPDDGVKVKYLQTSPGHQHNGYASALMDDLYHRHPGTVIDHGSRSSEGANWWNTYQDPEPEHNADNWRHTHRPEDSASTALSPDAPLHRGLTLHLPDDVHAAVNTPDARTQADRGDAAHHLLEHLDAHGTGLGTYWSDDHDFAKDYAYGPPGATALLLHGRPQDPGDVRDPSAHTPGWPEVPLRYGAPVDLTGMSWRTDGDGGHWKHHDFDTPITRHAAEDTLAAFQARAAHLDPRSTGGAPADGSDLAQAARAHLAKTALKDFSAAERRALISEGEGVRAANSDRLDLTGTHYAELEALLSAEGERDGDPAWLA